MARARKSGQAVANGAGASSKRSSGALATPPRRQSQRISSSAGRSSTPKKSVYFEHGTDDEDSASDASDGYEEAHESSESEPESGSEPDDASETDEETTSRKRKRVSTGSSTPRKRPPVKSSSTETKRTTSNGKELWREGVKSHLQPGEEVFIALPKAREAGKTAYRDETIHPNTLLFLGDLDRNNERQWLKLHDADFRQSERDWKSFVEAMTEKLTEYDETLPELPAKDIVFRIYRDVRFSKDPTPYKPHFSAAWSRTGRKGPYAAYYLQIAPGKSFVGGGLWCPEASYLRLLRSDFDQHPEHIKSTLADAGIRKEHLGGAESEKKALKEFLAHNKHHALKRRPKDYDEGHPNIELLKLKSFTMGRKLKDSEITAPKALDNIAKVLGAMEPFISYLNDTVMPDPRNRANNHAGNADSDDNSD